MRPRPLICLALLCCALAAAPLYGAKVKGDATYREGDKIVLVASELSSPDVRLLWDFSGTAELDYDESATFVSDPASTKEKPLPDRAVEGGKCAVWARAGRYVATLTAIDFTTKKAQRTRFAFTVEAVKPPPPPAPPGPAPAPADPLAAALQKGYDLDADADRAKSLAFLQAAYKGLAAQAAGRPEKTNAAFVAWMKSVVEAPSVGLSAAQIKSLRTAVGAELASAWGAAPGPLSAATAAAELTKIANALSLVK